MERSGFAGLDVLGLEQVGAAVSGGADSVFLLHALAERGIAAAVLHVNHKLRGEASDRDEQFVRDLAGALRLPFFCIVAPVGAGNLEQEARRERYAFFQTQIAAGHCKAVATGHTKDDQAETVLFRFVRGAGTAGLSGIRPRTASGIVRPLLEIRRDAIRASLLERGIEWREDASNADTAFVRNRIRLEIMPQLEMLNPSLAEVLASTSEWARGEDDYWEGELAQLEQSRLIRNGEALLVRTGDLTSLPTATQRRLIRRMVERVRGTLRGIDFQHGEAIRTLIGQTEGSGRLQLPAVDVYRSFDWLRISPAGFDSRQERGFEFPLTVPGAVEAPERGLWLTAEEGVQNSERVYNDDVYRLDRDKCAGSLVLRNWQPGDRLQPVGRHEEKIKTLFQENRVPLWERRNWPVIVSDRNIVWTRRFGVSAEFAVEAETQRILIVRESKPSGVTSIGSEGYPVSAGGIGPAAG